MPVTKSAKKAMKQANKRRVINRQVKNDMKIAIKVFMKKITKGDKLTDKDLSEVYKKIDKAQKKNILHKNTAARRKSLMAKRFNTAGSVAKTTKKETTKKAK